MILTLIIYLEYKSTTDKMDLHHSNVMSIALHSPNNSLTRQHRNKVIPVAKPRTVSPGLSFNSMLLQIIDLI